MDKYIEMLKWPNKRYKYSELELAKIADLLGYCHAVDVRMTHRRMYEVFLNVQNTVAVIVLQPKMQNV